MDKERILKMLKSSDEEMCYLGITTLMNIGDKALAEELIPWNIHKRQSEREPFRINFRPRFNRIWKNKDFCIIIWSVDNLLLCRTLVMTRLMDIYIKIEVQ